MILIWPANGAPQLLSGPATPGPLVADQHGGAWAWAAGGSLAHITAAGTEVAHLPAGTDPVVDAQGDAVVAWSSRGRTHVARVTPDAVVEADSVLRSDDVQAVALGPGDTPWIVAHVGRVLVLQGPGRTLVLRGRRGYTQGGASLAIDRGRPRLGACGTRRATGSTRSATCSPPTRTCAGRRSASTPTASPATCWRARTYPTTEICDAFSLRHDAGRRARHAGADRSPASSCPAGTRCSGTPAPPTATRSRRVGAMHHPIRSAYDFGGQGIDEAFPELVGLTGIAMVRAALPRIFIAPGPGMLRDLQAILADYPADVAVSEALFVATRWLHELGGPPWATLGETMLGTYSRDTAPFGPGLLADARAARPGAQPGHEHGAPARDLQAGDRRATRPRGPRSDCAPLGRSFLDTLVSPFLYLQGDGAVVRVPAQRPAAAAALRRPAAPAAGRRLHAAGVVAGAHVGAAGGAGHAGDGRQRPAAVIAPTLEALADEDVLVVATADRARARRGPGQRPRASRSSRTRELLPHVSALVTNGGYGGLQQALAHGVPIVVAGATEDKPETAARVAWSGVGPAHPGAVPGPRARARRRAARAARAGLPDARAGDRRRDGDLRRAGARRRPARAAGARTARGVVGTR